MTNQTNISPSKPTFWQNLGRFLRAAFRLILFVLVIIALISAVYYTAPYVYSYFITPVQNNRALIDHLQRNQAQLQEDLNSQIASQRERITQLETDLAAEREAHSALENTLAQQAEELSNQNTAQTELEEQVENQGRAITTLEQSVDAQDASLNDLDSSMVKVEAALAAPEAEFPRLQRQILLLQLQQTVLKARLHLLENNAGQADLALTDANESLEALNTLLSAEEQRSLLEIQAQLTQTKDSIKTQPFIAAQEMDILWSLLQDFADQNR
jgi:chromosome segregation ATPase